VLRLWELLKELDYTQFYPRYRMHGRKALHPRTLLGLIVYGILMRGGSLRELERLARTDLGAMWLSAGISPITARWASSSICIANYWRAERHGKLVQLTKKLWEDRFRFCPCRIRIARLWRAGLGRTALAVLSTLHG